MMNNQSYLKAQKRIVELQELQKRLPVCLSYDDQEELNRLMEACQSYADSLDADAQREYEFMQDFEDRFLSSMER
jgi:hypothetical protein